MKYLDWMHRNLSVGLVVVLTCFALSACELESLDTMEPRDAVVEKSSQLKQSSPPDAGSESEKEDTSENQDAVENRDLLEAFFKATGGEEWIKDDKWLTKAPLDEWHGVTTDENGRVTELRLVLNGLEGEIPPEAGSLTSLVYLDLSGNLLTGGIPAEMGDLTNLQVLNLHANRLGGEIPPELGESLRTQLGGAMRLAMLSNNRNGRHIYRRSLTFD